jgi:hypothetical protein
LEQPNPATDEGTPFALCLFGKPAEANQASKPLDVFREYHRVVQQLLMAFVTEDYRLAFVSPRASVEDCLSLGSSAVRRAAEKAFGDVMV